MFAVDSNGIIDPTSTAEVTFTVSSNGLAFIGEIHYEPFRTPWLTHEYKTSQALAMAIQPAMSLTSRRPARSLEAKCSECSRRLA